MYLKRKICCNQLIFIPEMQSWFNIQKLVNVVTLLTVERRKKTWITSIVAENRFNKVNIYSY